jgi:hypothetical protein
VLATLLSVFAVMLLAGHNRWSGTPVLQLTRDHGVNTGDVFVVACWAAGMIAVWRLAVRCPDRPPHR